MGREAILRDVRRNLGRSPGQPPPPLGPPLIRVPAMDRAERIERMLNRVAALAGKTLHARSKEEALDYVRQITEGRTAVASNEPFLREAGIASLPWVRSGITGEQELRDLCAKADFGITSATYALADTGTLVMIASREEARLVSLLPPVHIAIVPVDRLLASIDELYALETQPMESSSSLVLITGPSRTADIEQILVRGVHGPGEIHVVLVD